MILIDSRVGSKELLEYLPTGTAELSSLEFGDVLFSGNVSVSNEKSNIIIERKTIGDFIDSMRSGRLVDYQLPGMLEWADVVYLLIEGGIRKLSAQTVILVNGRWIVPEKFTVDYAEFHGYILSLQHHTPFRILRTLDIRDSAELISKIYSYWSQPYNTHQSTTTVYTGHGGASFTRLPLRRRFTCLIPGIKGVLSSAIADRFPSIEEMLSASVEDWMSIPGIGPKRAESITKLLSTERRKP